MTGLPERVRLAEAIADARKLLTRISETGTGDTGPPDIGELAAALRSLAYSAEFAVDRYSDLALIADAMRYAGVPDAARLAAAFLASLPEYRR